MTNLLLQPGLEFLQERWATTPATNRRYPAQVERWRPDVAKLMPANLRDRPDAAYLVDKALHVIQGESGGDPSVTGDGGIAHGLFQSHYVGSNASPEDQIADAWRLISRNPQQWTDWGEGVTYEGKPFGALGNYPYENGPISDQTGPTVASSYMAQSIRPPNTGDAGITPSVDDVARTVTQRRISAQEARDAVAAEENRAYLEQELGTPGAALPHEEAARTSHGDDPAYDWLREDTRSGYAPAPTAASALDQHLSTGATRFSPLDVANPADYQTLLEQTMQATAPPVSLDQTPAGLEDVASGTRGTLRGRLLNQPAPSAGDYVQTRPVGDIESPITTLTRAAQPAFDAYDALNPEIPYVTPFIEDVVKPIAAYGINATPAGRVLNAASQAVGGPDVGKTTADMAIPTKAADIALTAAPFVGEAGKGATALRGAAERYATGGLERGAGVVPEAAATVEGRLAARGLVSPEGGAMTAQEMIAKLRAQGMEDSAIAEAAKMFAPAGTAEQIAADIARESAGEAAAARRVFNRTLDETSDVEAATKAAREAAAKTKAEFRSRMKPNQVVPTEGTAKEMQAAMRRARGQEDNPLEGLLTRGGPAPKTEGELQGIVQRVRKAEPGAFDTPEIVAARAEQQRMPETHKINTPARRKLRENIANELYGTGAERKEKVAEIVMGPPASGKSSRMVEPLAQQNGSLVIDADAAKEMLPEFGNGRFAGAVHKESSDIADGVLERAIQAGDNVVLPVVGKNEARIRAIGEQLAAHGYKVNLRLVDLPETKAAARAAERFAQTGRFVDPDYVMGIDGHPASTFDKLKGESWVNDYLKVSNDVPRGEAPSVIESGTNTGRRGGGRDLGNAQANPQANPPLNQRTVLEAPANSPEAAQLGETAGRTYLPKNLPPEASGPYGTEVGGGAPVPTSKAQLSGGTAGTPGAQAPKQHWNVLDEALGALGAPQTIMASSDIGQIGRQAQILGWSNPKEFKAAVEQGIKAYGSEAAQKAADAAVKASPWHDFAESVGVHFYETGSNVSSGQRVPGFGGLGRNSRISQKLESLPPVKASERSLATTLNVQGMQVFEKYADAMWNAGVTNAKAYEDLARVINHARGYGTGGVADLASSANVFFSARNMVSRFQVLLDPVTASGSFFTPSARQLAAKNLASFIGAQSAMLGLLGVSGAATGLWSVNADPRAGDFGQLRIGNTRIDTLAGFGPIVKLMARVGSEGADAAFGTDLAKPTADWRQSIVSFFRNKEAPVPALVTNILSGKDNMGKPFAITPELAAQMFLPFIVNDVREAVKENVGENKLLGLPVAVASAIGLGTQSYGPGLSELRDKAAAELGAKDYATAGPVLQDTINNRPEIKEYRQANQSPYQEAKVAAVTPIDNAQQQAEQAFTAGNLSRPIADIWHDLGNQRRGVSAGLEASFAKQFAGFDKTKYENAVEGYFSKEVKTPDGQVDFDATESARQDYLKTLPADQQDWIDQTLKVSRKNQTKLRGEYLDYIDAKKQAGYFAIKPGDADYSAKRKALDVAHPELDAQAWYFNGGQQGKSGGQLLTKAAVDQALGIIDKEHLTGRTVHFQGAGRDLASEGGRRLWADYGQKLQNIYDDAKIVKANQALLDWHSQKLYNVPFAQANATQKARLIGEVRSNIFEDDPKLDGLRAYLGFGGDSSRKVYTYHSPAAKAEIDRLKSVYGAAPATEGWKYLEVR